MLADRLTSEYRRLWWGLVLRGLLAVAVGGLILWRPLESVAAFALFIALWALFTGMTQIVQAFEVRPLFERWWVVLLGGLLSVGFGVAALYYYPVLSLAFAVAWTAWWLLFSGAFAIYGAVLERQVGASWGWTLAFGILSIAAGVFAILSPPLTLTALMGVIAGFALAGGVVLLIGAARLSSLKSDVAEMVGHAPAR